MSKVEPEKSSPEQPPRKRSKKTKPAPIILEFRRKIHECCRTNDFHKAKEAYFKAVDDNIDIEAGTYYNLLNLCDGLGDRSVHVGSPVEPAHNQEPLPDDQVPIDERKEFASTLKAHMDEKSLPLSESGYFALLKLLSRSGELGKAFDLLGEAENTQQCRMRLRTYTPLLVAYAQRGDIMKACELWKRLSDADLALTEKEYLELIQGAIIAKSSILFERVLSDLAEDVLVPAKTTTQAIIEWFRLNEAREDEKLRDVLAEIHIKHQPKGAPSMGPIYSPKGWMISDPCSIAPETGRLESGCMKGRCLRPVSLSKEAWDEMTDMNSKIVTDGGLEQNDSVFEGGGKGKKRKLNEEQLQERYQHWQDFQDFLKERCQHSTIDFVVDGANIGFFECNFAGAAKHVDYYQIDWVVEHLRRQNKSILLVMHSRHFTKKMMPQKYEHLLRKWLDLKILYRTPFAMNDDWFWMQAALHSGPGTLVLTNDEMRDHHFQMMAPRSFLRWKERHQVHFSFGNWTSVEKYRHREVLLEYPEIYSRRIQRIDDGLVIPLPKKGDENRFLDGVHIAQDETTDELYVCIKPN